MSSQRRYRGRRRTPPTKRRPLRDSDAIWLRLDSSQAKGMRGPKDRPTRFDILLGLPAKASDPVPVQIARPRLRPEEAQAIRAELSGGTQRRRLRVRIPWTLLRLSPPKGDASLGVNFAMTCHRRGTQPPWRLIWADAGQPALLLTP